MRSSRKSLGKVRDLYLQDMQARNRRGATMAHATQLLRWLDDFGNEHNWPKFEAIKKSHVNDFLIALKCKIKWDGKRGKRKKRISNSYYSTLHTRLKTFFKWSEERGYTTTSPMALSRKPKVAMKIIPTIPDDEIRALFDVLDPSQYVHQRFKFLATRDRAALSLLVDTPIRKAEITGLRVRDVDFGSREVKVMGKGRKERTMKFSENTAILLEEYLTHRDSRARDTNKLWMDVQGRDVGLRWLRGWLEEADNKARQAAGKEPRKEDDQPNLLPRRFRHTWTIRAIENNISTETICLIAGWSELPKTYKATLGQKQARAAQEKLSPMNRIMEDLRGSSEQGLPMQEPALKRAVPTAESMLQSEAMNTTPPPELYRSRAAVDSAVDSERTEDGVLGVLQTSGTPNGYDENTVFTELPEGLIDLPSATAKYSLNRATLRSWLTRGRIRIFGRLKGSASGGGYLVVDESELVAHLSSTRLVDGTPDKMNDAFPENMAKLWEAIGNAVAAGQTEDELLAALQSKTGQNRHTNGVAHDHSDVPSDVEPPIYDELPEGLISLPSVTRKYGLRARTVQDWVKLGRINLRGRLRGPAPGGGYLVVSEAELVAYMNAPRNKGGRPRKGSEV